RPRSCWRSASPPLPGRRGWLPRRRDRSTLATRLGRRGRADTAAVPAEPQASAPSYTPAAAEPGSPPTPAVVVRPILDEVRQQLAQPARGTTDRTDRAVLAAFYADPGANLLWVKADGFTSRAQNALAEVRRAEDWGLSVAAFDLPQLTSREQRPS